VNVASLLSFDLNALFETQERAAAANWQRSEFLRKSFAFHSDCLKLCLNFSGAERFADPKKATAIRMLCVDCLSHIIVAFRLAMWGAVPQSMATLRGALEASAVFTHIVFGQRYETAIYEASKKLDEIEFKSTLRQLGEFGKNIEFHWGRMSEYAHASSKRIRMAAYNYDGLEYDRVGGAVDPDGAASVSYFSMHPMILALVCLHKAAEQEPGGFPWQSEYEGLLARFKVLCEDFKKETPSGK
jgi:hypothetical protein